MRQPYGAYPYSLPPVCAFGSASESAAVKACRVIELWRSAILALDARRSTGGTMPTADCNDWFMVGLLSFAAGAIILLEVWILLNQRR